MSPRINQKSMFPERLTSTVSFLRDLPTTIALTGSLIVVVLLMGVAEAKAQVPQRVITECKACGASDVHAADLTGEGNPDILSASSADNKIAWYENQGGSFSAQRAITTDAEGPQSVYAADLNGSGDLDVLSASSNDDKIAWYENNGGGSFSGQQVITTNANGATSVYAADLTGNGNPDVLSASDSASSDTDRIAWYKNNGDGTFSNQKIITTDADGAADVHAADLNGDGNPDVLSADRDKVAWYKNLGDGSFSDQKIITTDLDATSSVYTADLTGNGTPDVLYSSFGGPNIGWHENNGDGSFSDQRVITTDAVNARSVYAKDLTGSGDLDVLSASSNDDKIAWYKNNGDGTFSDQKFITIDASGASSVYAVDLTGSGDPDVLSASFDDDKIAWHENGENGKFSDEKVITECRACGASDVFAADLTGDGNSDVLSADRDEIAWHENSGGGTFSDQKVITDVNGDASVHAADLTGDDNPDVLAADIDKIAWYGNLGGSFSSQQVITNDATGAADVYATDLSGDGAPDVLSIFRGGRFDNPKVAWYENEGGFFSNQKVIATDIDEPESVYAADLTDDGDKDVLSASFNDDKIAWYENNGDGTFSDQKIITTDAVGALSVYAADLTGNGTPDVLSASRGDSSNDPKIAWYKNNGDGTFSDQRIITTDVDRASGIYAADLTGNGNPDVLSTSGGDDKIAWHKNHGDGTFSDQKIVTTDVDGVSSVHVADLTGSGFPDVLSSSLGDDKIAWYENTEGVLPVELSTLSAHAIGTGARISWQTASETNNAGFHIQHRAPSSNRLPDKPAGEQPEWERLGFVEGAGTTTEINSYRFIIEKDLKLGNHRFRLRQVDTDGTAHLSKTVSLRVRMKEKIHLSAPTPNPIKDGTQLTFAVKETEKTTVHLYNMLGQRVSTLYRGRAPAGEPVRLNLDASRLASGTYVIRLRAGGATETRKVTVVR